MAVKITNTIITTGSQFTNKYQYESFLQLNSSLVADEEQLFETFRTQNKLLDKSITFNNDQVTVIRYMDSLESMTELQRALTNLYTSYGIDWNTIVSGHNWQYNFVIDENASIPV